MSLTPEQDVALALLRVAARPRRQADERLGKRVAQADPSRLMKLLRRTRIDVSLGPMLVEDPSVKLPTWFGEQVMAARSLARKHGLLQHSLTERLTSALRDHGVRVIPLKGTTLADSAHGELGARQSEDIDLLVARSTMERAVDVVSGFGWEEYGFSPPPGELPRLHRVLVHPSHPPVELHWRVHWYESTFSEDAITRAVEDDPTTDRLLPADELATLLLFFARDGLTGLRQAADVAAWWCSTGVGSGSAQDVARLRARYPLFAAALGAAACWTEKLTGLEPGSLMDPSPPLSRPQRLALRLANPWLEGSRQQIDAEVSLIDGLLGPPRHLRAFARRNLTPPVHEVLTRSHGLDGSSRAQVARAQGGHALRVLARYGLAARRLGPK